ncbi:flagellar basal body rod protein FlgC [Alicyclobacillus mengziensis]|uniref:Flagellar basal-body rod protein FlgC n=1 Tax=Alicyclobacillus mengziensis TaxID=2931921 RepID=A0A9X7Z7X7_9BACL|nr:flagellar basal body rod protein FlgC [Alicyclobacillus mengziensis]QSO49564.1 flagellar basal body rod protein FlgC [Alicyclobacillus mengziensis]
MSGWLGALGISASGLSAQRLEMDVIANNIANVNTTRTASGGPYRREMVVLQPGGNSTSPFQNALLQASGTVTPAGIGQNAGVQVAGIVQDPSPFKLVYDPTNPDAVNGYVQMPNVNISTEMTDMMSASRAYEANVTAFDAGKQLIIDALGLGK